LLCYFSALHTNAFSDDLTCYYKRLPDVITTIPVQMLGPCPNGNLKKSYHFTTEVKVTNMSEKDVINYSIRTTEHNIYTQTDKTYRDKMPPINPKQTAYKKYFAQAIVCEPQEIAKPPLYDFWVSFTHPSPRSPQSQLSQEARPSLKPFEQSQQVQPIDIHCQFWNVNSPPW
jgi:hypothetical protein